MMELISSTYTYETSEPYYWYSSSSKSGCLFTKDNVFKIDKKLNSASLSEVEINVNDWKTQDLTNLFSPFLFSLSGS